MMQSPRTLMPRFFVIILWASMSQTICESLSEDEDAYKRQFSKCAKLGITADELEDKYKACHAKIRENPVHEKKEKKPYEKKRRFTAKRLTYEQRKAKAAAAKKEWLRKIAAGEIQPKA